MTNRRPQPPIDPGTALAGAGRYAEAEPHLRAFLASNPTDVRVAYNLGVTLKALGRRAEAANLLAAILKRHPRHFGAAVNLSNIHYEAGAFDEAEAMANRAARLDPIPEVLHNLGLILRAQRRSKEAVRVLNRARVANPSPALARWIEWDGALALLQSGNYVQGLPAYESRHAVGRSRRAIPLDEVPAWDGRPAADAHLIVTFEQGMGDSIQFARYLARVRALVGRLTLEVQQPLAPLFAGLADAIVAVPLDDTAARPPGGPYDLQVAMMSLPLLLGERAPAPIDAPTFSAALPPPPAALQVAGARPRIGLVWQGRRDNVLDRQRSIPLSTLLPMVAARPDIEFFSLQVGDGAEQLAAIPPGLITDLPADMPTTAAALGVLDGLVSVDSALVHLAGALMRPVFALVAKCQDWRWGEEGETTPWYPTVRLFRQQRHGDWGPVVDAIAAALPRR